MESTHQTPKSGSHAIVTDETEIRPRVTLSTGTVLAFRRMENGATACDPTHGGSMTNAEWIEYTNLVALAQSEARRLIENRMIEGDGTSAPKFGIIRTTGAK